MSIKQPLQIMVFNNIEERSQVNSKWKEQDMQMYSDYDYNYGNTYLSFEPEHSKQSSYPSEGLSGILLVYLFSWFQIKCCFLMKAFAVPQGPFRPAMPPQLCVLLTL